MHRRILVPAIILAISSLLLVLLPRKGGQEAFFAAARTFAAVDEPADEYLFPYKHHTCHPACCAQNPTMSCSRGCLCCRKPQ